MIAHHLILFFVEAFFIIFFTQKLAKVGKAISDLTSLSGGFIGFTLFAIITSMPEVAMSISAVSYIKDVNLCGGDIFGSNLFNLTIIGIIEIFICKGKFLSSLPASTKKTVFLQILFTFIPLSFVLIHKNYTFFNFSYFSFIIIILYFVLTRLHNFDDSDGEKSEPQTWTLTQAIVRFVIYSGIIIFCAIKITETCDMISKITGIGNSFLGALLLATVSSLPEITLCIALVQMNAPSIAIGNLLGSNFFNITILPIADLFMKDSIYFALSKIHFIPFIFTLVTSLIIIQSVGKTKRFSHAASFLIIISYVTAMFLLFVYSKNGSFF